MHAVFDCRNNIESCGNALTRIALPQNIGMVRLAWMAVGAALLYGYSYMPNPAPFEFQQACRPYIARLFIIPGGLILTFWKTE